MLDANIIYSRLLEIHNDKLFSNREKLILCFDVIKELFNFIIENENITYTEYALFHYILRRFEVSTELKTSIINLRKYISKLRKNNKLYPTKSFVEKAFSNIVKIVSYLTITDFPDEIAVFVSNAVLELPKKTDTYQSKTIKKLNAIITHKLSYNDRTLIVCQNDDNKYIVNVDKKIVYMCSMAKKLNTICFTELEEMEKIVSNLEEENKLFYDSIFYKTTDKTQIILEPNFLIDVTELTNCFQSKSSNPIISIVKRLYPNNIISKAAFEGNVINHFFDELLENIEVDFDTCINNALIKNPLHLLYVSLKDNGGNWTDNIIQKYLKNCRSKWFDKYNKLRDIVMENFLYTTNIVEPSFISDTYGLQGRLDLMIENIIEYETKSIDIIELKSSKAPTGLCNINIGLFSNRRYVIPLWVNHYIQVVCYNMLLEHILTANNFIKGNSTILYADPIEEKPLRSVVEDNILIQNEILLFRNYIVMFLKEIADKNISFIENINSKQIAESFPKYDIEQANSLINKLNIMSELEKEYFNLHISFVAREMFANKTGLYADTSHSNNYNGFSALWLNSIEEKILKGNAIDNLILDIKNSNFNNMHLTFIKKNKSKHYISNFRKDDICIMYQIKENDVIPTYNQLFRGKILEIDNDFVKISFRNKFPKNKFADDEVWCIENDYMEKSNTMLFNSVSNFVFNEFANKNCILGISEPTFTENEYINAAVNNISELDDEKKNIIINALSANNYFLIQGPPGTGKTSYILRYLTQILFTHSSENILLLAYTNRAVDEICASIAKIKNIITNFDFIRLGNKDSSKHIDNLLYNIELNAIESKINNCKVFVSTVHTANSNPELFAIKDIDTIIIDEAAQILETHIIGLLSKTKRFIMIGDEKQLPPITIIKEQKLKINSLFDRLLKICQTNNIPAYALLTLQRRMSPQIMSLVNNLFYDNKLRCSDITNNSADCFFINTPITTTNKVNQYEIDAIIKIIDKIKQNIDIKNPTIGIIAPWKAQCTAISAKINNGQLPIAEKNITIDTVERFQGSERDIIIFSTATNSTYLLNILSQSVKIEGKLVDRKLNVAITRAKKKFFLLGNYDILSQNSIYKKLIAQLEWIEV
jgi:DNA replication ATP-dependent helicase Dna2